MVIDLQLLKALRSRQLEFLHAFDDSMALGDFDDVDFRSEELDQIESQLDGVVNPLGPFFDEIESHLMA